MHGNEQVGVGVDEADGRAEDGALTERSDGTDDDLGRCLSCVFEGRDRRSCVITEQQVVPEDIPLLIEDWLATHKRDISIIAH